MALGNARYPRRGKDASPARPIALATVVLAALLFLPGVASASSVARTTASISARPLARPASVSLSSIDALGAFVENRGQVRNPDVRYVTASGGLRVGMVTSGLLISLPGREATVSDPALGDAEDAPPTMAVVRLSFVGSKPVVPQGRGPLPLQTNVFSGHDPAAWRTGLASAREVVYAGLYPGVDLVYRADASGLKYEFLLAPGADASRIRWTYAGAQELERRDGALAVRTAAGELLDAAPIASQDGRTWTCAYRLEATTVGLSCDGADTARPWTIDPLLYSTFLGGGQDSRGLGVAVDASGNAYLGGYTNSFDFPATPGAYDTAFGGYWDAYVIKLNPSGTGAAYATFLGGSGSDRGFALAVDAAGDAFLAGYTNSTDYPTTAGALRTTYGGAGTEAFVTELNPAGNGLVYSTYLGGSVDDRAYAIAVDASGSAYVTGRSKSSDFPVTAGAFQRTFQATTCGLTLCGHGFVSKLNANGSSLLYSSYLGGITSDRGLGIAVDGSGDAYVTGYTNSTDFPVTAGAYDATFHSGACGGFTCSEGFVAKVSPDGSALLYSTFLGGSKTDQPHEVAIDASGDAYVTGETNSTDFPVTAGAYQPTYPAGERHAFVTQLDPTGGHLLYSTFLGGSVSDHGHGLALDASGDAVVVGRTNSSDFPTTPGAWDTAFAGGSTNDAFVSVLSASGSTLLYSTFLGGTGDDWGNAIVLDAAGDAYLTGHTFSTDFPTTAGAFRPTFAGIAEAFATKLSLALSPTVRITSPGAGAVATTSVTMTGTSTRATRVQARAGGGTWVNATGVASWSATLDLSALPTGSVVLEARALNGTLESPPDSVTIQKAASAPAMDRCTVIPGVAAVQVGSTQAFAAIGWSGTTEIAGVPATWSTAGAVGTVDSAGMFHATAPGSGTVTAAASYGGTSATCSANVTVTAGAPPTVAITSPSGGSTVTTNAIVVRGTAGHADLVQVRADTGLWVDATGAMSSWSGVLDLSSYPNGQSLSIEARAFNGSVESTHERITVVKVLALAITIASPPNLAAVVGTVTVTGTATPGASVRVRFDSGSWQNVSASNGSWSWVLDTTRTFNGPHLVEAQAVWGASTSTIASREIDVVNPSPPGSFPGNPLLWLVLPLLVVLAAVAVVMVVARRRRREDEPGPGAPR